MAIVLIPAELKRKQNTNIKPTTLILLLHKLQYVQFPFGYAFPLATSYIFHYMAGNDIYVQQ